MEEYNELIEVEEPVVQIEELTEAVELIHKYLNTYHVLSTTITPFISHLSLKR